MALTSRLAQRGVSRGVAVANCRPLAHPFTAVVRTAARSSTVAVRAEAAVADAAVNSAPQRKQHPSLLSQAPPALYAVVEIGGQQMFVEPGKWYTCNRLAAEPGSKIKFGRVLAVKKDGQLNVGRPYLEDVTVEAEIVEELRGVKVVVYKMRPKKHYRRKQGHRQDLTKFRITSIA